MESSFWNTAVRQNANFHNRAHGGTVTKATRIAAEIVDTYDTNQTLTAILYLFLPTLF